MQISERFTVAVHILACVKYFEGTHLITSEFLAGSIGVNAVIVRRILLQLKKAGMISITKGRGGICLLAAGQLPCAALLKYALPHFKRDAP